MRLGSLALIALLGVGCLGDAAAVDMSANVDLSTGPSMDLFGFDFAGALNCLMLNQKEQTCLNPMCVAAYRQMATPSALAKDAALQGCFNQYCPQQSDLASPTCANKTDPGCVQCIQNTLKAQTPDCSPANAPECTKCYAQGQDCKNDL